MTAFCSFTMIYALTFLLLSVLPAAEATLSCTSTEECATIFLPGSLCENGFCTNPYQNGGCLRNRLEGWNQIRVCNSEDTPEAIALGYCRPPDPSFDYTEIRIATHNWESAFFQAWILQIVLTEILGVPATLETGLPQANLNFYDRFSRFEYGIAYPLDALRVAREYGDCRLVPQSPGKYQACAHMLPEAWIGEDFGQLQEEGTIEAPYDRSLLGEEHLFIPRTLAEKDPSLLSHIGLSGEEKRRKLAETFLRPTTWQDYCEQVSSTNCTEPDSVAQRPPVSMGENTRMFAEGLYTGHFRATNENNCTANPDTCTGHFVDYPCGWQSNIRQVFHHLNIPLKSSGPEAISGGYSYSQMTEIWAAANATKSNVLMIWWVPEALYMTFLNSDYEFQRVHLPPPTQDCVASYPDLHLRCDATASLEEILGSELGTCDEPPQILKLITSTSLKEITESSKIAPELRSPAYEAIKAFRIDALQIGKIFDYWLKRGSDKWNFDPRDATCRWAIDNKDFLLSLAPATYPRVIQENQQYLSSPLFYVSLVFGLVAVAFVVSAMIGTYIHRRKRSIINAQIMFLWILLAGLLMVSLGAVVLVMEATDGLCTASVWLIGMGYTLEMVPIVVKVSAINRIYNASRSLRRVILKQKNLYGKVALVSAVVLVFLIVWSSVDRPRRTSDFQLTTDMTDNGENIVLTTYFCESEADTWRLILLGWQVVLLLCATVLAYQNRQVRRDINEALILAIMVYSHFFFIVLRVIVFFLEDVLDTWDMVRYTSLIYSGDVCCTCLIYFYPKFFESDTPQNLTVIGGMRWSHVLGRWSRSLRGQTPPENDCVPSEAAETKTEVPKSETSHTVTVEHRQRKDTCDLTETEVLKPSEGTEASEKGGFSPSNAFRIEHGVRKNSGILRRAQSF